MVEAPILIVVFLMLVLMGLSATAVDFAAEERKRGYTPTEANLKARQWFQDARFGMFVHWGVYSLLGEGEWVMNEKEMTVEDYETGYRALLGRTRKELPDVRIVVCEPFVLRCGAVDDKWFPEFDRRRAVARKLAAEMGLSLVPFQSMFDEATKAAPPQYWAGDGVHPTLAGHALMAKTWREVVGI